MSDTDLWGYWRVILNLHVEAVFAMRALLESIHYYLSNDLQEQYPVNVKMETLTTKSSLATSVCAFTVLRQPFSTVAFRICDDRRSQSAVKL